MTTRSRSVAVFLFSVFWFAAWQVFNTAEAWKHPTHQVPGLTGDNLCMLWNLGWMRHAVSQGSPGFWCNTLFYPEGFLYLFSTHTWLDGLLGALFAPLLPAGEHGPILWYNMMQLFATVTTGLFGMAMLREFGVRRWPIQLLGASLPTFCWFRGFAVIGHQHFYGTEWMMAAMWAAARSRRLVLAHFPKAAGPWAFTGGLFLGITLLNDQALMIFGGLLCIAVFISQLIASRGVGLSAAARQVVLFGMGFLLGGGAHLWGYAFYWGKFKYYVSDLGRPRLVDFTTILLPPNVHILFGSIMEKVRRAFELRSTLWGSYIGILGYVFIAYCLGAVVRRFRMRRGNSRFRGLSLSVVFFSAAAAFFFILMMGEYFSIGQKHWFVLPGRVLRHIPVVNNIRLLYRWSWPFFVCLSIAGSLAVYLRYGYRWNIRHTIFSMILAAVAALESRWNPNEATNMFTTVHDPPGLTQAVRANYKGGGVLVLPPDEWYRSMLLSYHWGYDIPITTGISARAPFNVLEPPWEGRSFSPGAAEYLRSKDVRMVVLLREDPELWRDWIDGARKTVPDIIILDEKTQIVP